jgi:hypothetical protein
MFARCFGFVLTVSGINRESRASTPFLYGPVLLSCVDYWHHVAGDAVASAGSFELYVQGDDATNVIIANGGVDLQQSLFEDRSTLGPPFQSNFRGILSNGFGGIARSRAVHRFRIPILLPYFQISIRYRSTIAGVTGIAGYLKVMELVPLALLQCAALTDNSHGAT